MGTSSTAPPLPVLDSARNYLSNLSKISELDKEMVRSTSTYSAPENSELTESQVQRFARVQDSVKQSLGQRMNEIKEKYKRFKSNSDNHERPGFSDMLSALNDLAGVFTQARRYQVDALNKEKFSQDEYSWVRDRVFQAAGKEVVSVVDLKKIGEQITTTRAQDVDVSRAPSVPLPPVPEKNRELVKPYLDRMESWIPLAFFGL